MQVEQLWRIKNLSLRDIFLWIRGKQIFFHHFDGIH
jgi:hypothetical protein